jgi:hypothetical protein
MRNREHQQEDFASAFERALARLQGRIEAACTGEPDWPRQIAAGINAAFEFARTEPDSARVLTVEARARGGDGFDPYARMIFHFGSYLLPGRELSPDGGLLPEITEQALVGGVATMIAQRLGDGRRAELPEVRAEATQLLLTPYIGADEARRVAADGSGRL